MSLVVRGSAEVLLALAEVWGSPDLSMLKNWNGYGSDAYKTVYDALNCSWFSCFINRIKYCSCQNLEFEETKDGSLRFYLLTSDVGCRSCRLDLYCSIIPASQFQRTAFGGPCWCLVSITIKS